MNLSHNALRDLTALTEFKSVGGILERHFVLLKEHVTQLLGQSYRQAGKMANRAPTGLVKRLYSPSHRVNRGPV